MLPIGCFRTAALPLKRWAIVLLMFLLLVIACRLQQDDVNDPWLQQEWGLMQVASGRLQESLPHLEVAGGGMHCTASPCLAAWLTWPGLQERHALRIAHRLPAWVPPLAFRSSLAAAAASNLPSRPPCLQATCLQRRSGGPASRLKGQANSRPQCSTPLDSGE